MTDKADARAESSRSAATRRKLVDATLTVIIDEGLAGVSARTVANKAGVNQALIFYHFDTIAGLIDAAYDTSVAVATDRYLAALGSARTVREVLDITGQLRESEPARGEVLLMAQLLAAVQHDPALMPTAQRALSHWSNSLTPVISTTLANSGLDALLDAESVTDFVISGFIGLDLVESVADGRGQRSRAVLNDLVDLLATIEALPAPARRTLVSYFKRSNGNR